MRLLTHAALFLLLAASAAAAPAVRVAAGFDGIHRVGAPLHLCVQLENDGPAWSGRFRAEETLNGRLSAGWEWPVEVPASAKSFAVASVKPKRIWSVAEKLMAYELPMQHTLVSAQLDSVETQLGKSLTEDALGDEARLWMTYTDSRGREVLIAGAKDATLAEKIIGGYAELLPSVFPELHVERTRRKGVAMVTLSKVVFGSRENRPNSPSTATALNA